MKIRIIGNSGSGKSYWVKRLSERYKISHYDLDDIVWNNSSNEYGVKHSREDRDKLLNTILEVQQEKVIYDPSHLWKEDKKIEE